MENGITNHDFESDSCFAVSIYQNLKLHMYLPEFTKKFKFYLSIINKFTLKKCMQCISSSIKMPSGQTMHCDSKQCVAKPNNALQLPWALKWWTAGREKWWEIRKWTNGQNEGVNM